MIVQCWTCGGAVSHLRKLDVGVDGKVWSVDLCDVCRRKIARRLREACAECDGRRPECRRDAHCPHCDAFRQDEPIDAVSLQDMIGPRPLDDDLGKVDP